MKEIISSEQNNRVKSLKKLYNKQKRRQKGKFILEGYRIIHEALKSDARFDNIFMSPEFYKSQEGQDILALFTDKDPDNNLLLMEEKLLKKIADTNTPQGVIAVVNEPEYLVEDIFSPNNKMGKLLLLDRIQDPGNMGTIIRTAVAAGIEGIIILKGSVDIYNLKVLRATMGAIFNIPLLKDISLEEFLNIYQEQAKNYQLIAADLAGELYYHQLEYIEPFIIAIGNEANGLQKKLIDSANHLIKIPIIGDIDSLNAAMATGIIVYKALENNC